MSHLDDTGFGAPSTITNARWARRVGNSKDFARVHSRRGGSAGGSERPLPRGNVEEDSKGFLREDGAERREIGGDRREVGGERRQGGGELFVARSGALHARAPDGAGERVPHRAHRRGRTAVGRALR